MSKFHYRSGYSGSGPLRKFLTPERKIDAERREITFRISTQDRDRDGDVIMQDGWDLENYQKNPVVLWAHDGGQPPVARTKRIKVQGNELIATAEFPNRETYEFGDTVFRMYKGGFLNATSVGFQPTELELMEGPEPGDFGFRFMKQELLEFSAVPIPSNPEALIMARSQGFDVNPLKSWIERALDEGIAGSSNDLLQKTFIALNGKLHPSLQAKIAEANSGTLQRLRATEAKNDSVSSLPVPGDVAEAEDEEEEAAAPDPTIASTGPTDNPEAADPHTHELEVGAAQTEPSEEDGHVHALTVDEETGEMTVENAEGHTHDVSATVDVEEDAEPEETDGNENPQDEDDIEVETPINDPTHPNFGHPTGQREFTDWPQKGMNLDVSLLTSDYRAFPIAEAKVLREDWPEIWDLGEGDLFDALVEGKSNAIRARELWAARGVDGWELKQVVSQVRHLVRGARGLDHMRKVLSEAKETMAKDREAVTPSVPASVDEDALMERILERAVVPAIEAAIRRHSGRVS